eukprot:6178358-Pleurochrysis_carterae.AAC.4
MDRYAPDISLHPANTKRMVAMYMADDDRRHNKHINCEHRKRIRNELPILIVFIYAEYVLCIQKHPRTRDIG